MEFKDFVDKLQPWQQLIALFLALYGLAVIIGKILKMFGEIIKTIYRSIWPGRDSWAATSSFIPRSNIPESDPNMAFLYGRRKRWYSLGVQEKDVFYTLDIGKGRLISSIEFDSGVSLEQHPAKYKMVVADAQQKVVFDIEDEGPIKQELKESSIIQYVRVVIIEPNKMQNGTSYHWSIHDIKLKEIRLFGLWKATI